MTSGTSGCNTYTANSIYSRDNVIPYLLVYCVGAMVYRRHYMVNVVYSFFDNSRSTCCCFVDISTFAWPGVWDRYLSFPLWHCCRNVDIYCHHYAYRRVISLPFLRWRDHFRDCWNQFSLNALFIFYLNISSGLFRPLIFMAVSGIIAAIVVNSLVASSTLVWIVSVLTVLVWTLITALEKSTLHGYARMLYHSEFSSLPRCALFGALTLYLGIINAVVTLCRYIILMILEILLSFRP